MKFQLNAIDVGAYDDPTVEPLGVAIAKSRLESAALDFARKRESGPIGAYVRAGEELQRAAVAFCNAAMLPEDAEYRRLRDAGCCSLADCPVLISADYEVSP